MTLRLSVQISEENSMEGGERRRRRDALGLRCGWPAARQCAGGCRSGAPRVRWWRTGGKPLPNSLAAVAASSVSASAGDAIRRGSSDVPLSSGFVWEWALGKEDEERFLTRFGSADLILWKASF